MSRLLVAACMVLLSAASSSAQTADPKLPELLQGEADELVA